MNTQLHAALQFVKNKAVAIIVTIVAAVIYLGLSSPSGSPLPFLEVFYAGILLSSVSVMAPLIRLLVFPEAAEYAESGALRDDIAKDYKTNGILHYWFATGICWVSSIAAITSLI